jgi:hypothetical protein
MTSDYVKIVNTPKGYIMEVKMPWGMLPDDKDQPNVNVAPKAGAELGFNYLANDSDLEDGTSSQQMAMSFSGIPSAWQKPSAWTTVKLAPLASVGTKGDMNGDGRVNVADATLSLQIAVGNLTPTEAQKFAGDVNGDAKWDLRDTTLILKQAVGG